MESRTALHIWIRIGTKITAGVMAATREAKEYRARAAEFERLADEASNPNSREVLLLIAERWATLAENVEAEGLIRSSPVGTSQALH
jgi:hypothetical protein